MSLKKRSPTKKQRESEVAKNLERREAFNSKTRRTIKPKKKLVVKGVEYRFHNTAHPPSTRDWDSQYAKTTAIHRAARFTERGLKTKIVEGKKDGRTVYHLYVEKKVDKLPKERKFNVGHITRIFEEAGRYRSRTDAAEAADKLGDRYYTRVTKVKVKDYADPRPFQLWKKKKPAWK